MPAAPHNDNRYLTTQDSGAFIDAVAHTPTKDPLNAKAAAARLTPSNFAPGVFWASNFANAAEMEAADVADAEALGNAGVSMGLLGFLGGSPGGDDDSDHGLSDGSEDLEGQGRPDAAARQPPAGGRGELNGLGDDADEDGGGGGGSGIEGDAGAGADDLAAARRQLLSQGVEIAELQERVQDLLEKVHDVREGRREAEDRLAWAMERLHAARQLLADRGVAFEIAPAGVGAAEEEEVSEGGGAGPGFGADGAGAEAGGGGGGPSGVVGPRRAGLDGAVNGSGGGGAAGAGPADSAKSLGRPWDGQPLARQPRRSASNWSESAAGGGGDDGVGTDHPDREQPWTGCASDGFGGGFVGGAPRLDAAVTAVPAAAGQHHEVEQPQQPQQQHQQQQQQQQRPRQEAAQPEQVVHAEGLRDFQPPD
ncbi:hypothetical protein MNEG_3088 [Monoraphidium neglectum]|uniref:Uncharacterized protein n=1 Tax=Monoraphidium neglectum TaxID=145388 RepID=A0A0D2MWN7_9CHLO|nr:hypothetical protein MNEG_3088 [Monoraphidium neglectum]KIZ04872.1 hypothetical protein MNEG_3088 [Monoraphidium neglectum]|eukprot:XP_013903891.1 hypothetical protein MNEG_3088 [Monoraphidium neglectum]